MTVFFSSLHHCCFLAVKGVPDCGVKDQFPVSCLHGLVPSSWGGNLPLLFLYNNLYPGLASPFLYRLPFRPAQTTSKYM